MMETIPLSQWMPSRWATVETAGDNVKKRASTWPKEVSDVAKGEFDVISDNNTIEETKSTVDDKVYHLNAVVIAYLLVQHIMGTGNGTSSKINVDPNSIQVVFTVEEEASSKSCSLDSVSAVLQPSTGKLRSIFYSLTKGRKVWISSCLVCGNDDNEVYCTAEGLVVLKK